MRTTGMRLVAAVVATSLAVTGLSPLAYAQQQVPPVESTPLEGAEQPMLPTPVPPPPDPAVAPAQPVSQRWCNRCRRRPRHRRPRRRSRPSPISSRKR